VTRGSEPFAVISVGPLTRGETPTLLWGEGYQISSADDHASCTGMEDLEDHGTRLGRAFNT